MPDGAWHGAAAACHFLSPVHSFVQRSEEEEKKVPETELGEEKRAGRIQRLCFLHGGLETCLVSGWVFFFNAHAA